MKSVHRRHLKLVPLGLLVSALSACGGGGGDGVVLGGGDDGSSSTASVELSDTSLVVESPETRGAVRWSVSSSSTHFGIAVVAESDVRGVQGARILKTDATAGEIELQYVPASTLDAGSHADRLKVIFCEDWESEVEYRCARHLEGSPVSLDSTYIVRAEDTGGGVVKGEYAPTILSRTAFDHNVVDAVYSREIDALVVAASSPTNAIHIYKLGQEQAISLPLDAVPRAVSVDDSGGNVTIAVGHDAWVSVFKSRHDRLAAASKALFNLSTTTHDIENSHTAVYVSPEGGGTWVKLHRLDIASNTETLSTSYSLKTGSRIKVHPNGKYLYAASTDLSPSYIDKYDIQGAAPHNLYMSPDHGGWEKCGDLWMSHSGERIYTPCGNVFNASSRRELDMRYSGSLKFRSAHVTWKEEKVRSLSESPSANEISAVVDSSRTDKCEERIYVGPCSRLELYSHDVYNPTSTVIFDNFSRGGRQFPEEPQYTFHSRDGDRLFALTALYGATSSKYHWVEIDRTQLPAAKPRAD